jgi:hypothetical protein
MTYHCGVSLGRHERPPRIVCDGCGAALDIRLPPPSWFLDGKPAPKWRMLRKGDGSRRWDLCPTCLKEPEYAPSESDQGG